MGLKKSGVKKVNSRPQGSELFGIVDKVTSVNHVENTIVDFPVPSNCQARKSAVTAALRAEYNKAQAITIIRQMSIR